MTTYTFGQPLPVASDDQGLWAAIRNRTAAIAFDRYSDFIEHVFCGKTGQGGSCAVRPIGCPWADEVLGKEYLISKIGHGTNAFHALRKATEVFLLLNCGVYISDGVATEVQLQRQLTASAANLAGAQSPGGAGTTPAATQQNGPVNGSTPPPCQCGNAGNAGAQGPLLTEDTDGVNEEDGRIPNWPTDGSALKIADLRALLDTYMNGTGVLPYLDDVLKQIIDGSIDENLACTPLCTVLMKQRVKCPCMLELIWSYWMEAGGQVQSMKAIAMRFQNRRSRAGHDPLADLDIDPLRPLSNLIWGYVQDDHNRLTVLRRTYEYDHHYGLALKGKAIPALEAADSRSKFLEGFHNLLRTAVEYYKVAEDTTKVPDGFPLLNALKEVHLALAEGACNQYGDLPWQARVEMLMEQWIMARTELREFLGGRIMVPYPAEWMGRVDTMRKLQGWGDTSIRYFYDLAIHGERLLLSTRYGNWSSVTDENNAKNWANYWRQEIQGYIHAYRVVTGVDLSDTKAEQATVRRMNTPPSELIAAGNRPDRMNALTNSQATSRI